MKKKELITSYNGYEFKKDDFEFATNQHLEKDKKFETKAIGYFADAFRRFCKNKGSVVAALIILVLVLYALIGPYCIPKNFTESYGNNKYLINYKELRPKIQSNEGSGFIDGGKDVDISRYTYDVYRGMGIETGHNTITNLKEIYTVTDPFGSTSLKFKCRIDTYYTNSNFIVTCTQEEYLKLQQWQDENNIQVVLPLVDTKLSPASSTNRNIWYVTNQKGNATYKEGTKDENGIGELIPAYVTTGEDDYTSLRISSDPYKTNYEGRYRYARITGKGNYEVRVSSYDYFIYMYGFEPCFLFGTDSSGYDIFSRLASGARFSFILAISVSVINLFIGAIYGAIEGYYGGVTDMIMERISDILSGVPFTVVAVLFKMHVANKVGMVGSLIFAFIMTGWIGMASSTRMQFYRFKNQEYVLAARTLGANDRRIMFKHIFPNALGTLVTRCVLVIPGVIFSETSLTYLGIINLDSAARSSIGSMLSSGQKVMTSSPHVILFPAIFIALLEICFNLFGNGLRDAFNPALRGSEEE